MKRVSEPRWWLVSPLLLAAVATAGIQVHGVFTVDLAVSDVFLGGYLLLHWRRIRLPAPIVCFSAAGLVAASAVAALRAVAAGGDRATWGSTRMIGVLVVLVYLIVIADAGRSEPARRALIQAFVVGVLGFNLLFVVPGLGHSLLTPFPTGGAGRLAGGMFDQNSNGTLLAAVTLLALTTRPFSRGTSAAMAACGAGLLVLTYSRTAYLAFAAGLFAYLVLSLFVRPRNIVRAVSVLAVATVAGVALGVPERVREHFAHRPDTISTRANFFHLSLDYFRADPLLGAGFGAAQAQTHFVIHSTFFALLGETGIVGALSFVVLIGAVLVGGVAIVRRPTAPLDLLGLLAASACLLVASFGIDGLLHRHWWIVLGLLLGASTAVPKCELRPPARDAVVHDVVGAGAP